MESRTWRPRSFRGARHCGSWLESVRANREVLWLQTVTMGRFTACRFHPEGLAAAVIYVALEEKWLSN